MSTKSPASPAKHIIRKSNFPKNRPLTVVAHAADYSGCGLYRIIAPAQYLEATGAARVIQPKMTELGPDYHKYLRPDVVVWQRLHEKEHLELMKRVKADCPHAFIVYDIDDLLTMIPKKSVHKASAPTNMDAGFRQAFKIVDRVVVTTTELKRWAISMGARDVVVEPNYIQSKYVTARTDEINFGKVRIGWAGGASHTGDLEILQKAIREIDHDRVQWVFFGMAPEMDLPDNVEVHPFVDINQYYGKLKSLNLDLFLAPLEPNRFNKAKSDLKLIEAGAMGFAVVASRTEPYVEHNPPVYGWADTPQDYVDAINNFLNEIPEMRRASGDEMQRWVLRSRTYEANISRRNAAWFPPGISPWQPRQEEAGAKRELFLVSKDQNTGLNIPAAARFTDMDLACAAAIDAGADLLYMRPNTSIAESAVNKMRMTMLGQHGCAIVVPLASDGANSFPALNAPTQVSEQVTFDIQEILDSVSNNVSVPLYSVTHPVVLIRSQALLSYGAPDLKAYNGNMEAALAEYSAILTARKMINIQLIDAFAGAIRQPEQIGEHEYKTFIARDVSEILKLQPPAMPQAIREQLELRFVSAYYQGLDPRSFGYTPDYLTMSQLAVDRKPKCDGSKVQVAHYGEPFTAQTGKEIVFLCKPGSILHHNALGLVQDEMLKNDKIIVFSDHTVLQPENPRQPGKREILPYLKNGFDPILLESQDYMTNAIALPISWLNVWLKTPEVLTRGFVYKMLRDYFEGRPFYSSCKDVAHIDIALVREPEPDTDAEIIETIHYIEDYNKTFRPDLVSNRFRTAKPVPYLHNSMAVASHPDRFKAAIVCFVSHPEYVEPFLKTIRDHTDYPVESVIFVSNRKISVSLSGINYVEHVNAHQSVVQLMNSGAEIAKKMGADVIVFTTDCSRPATKTWLTSAISNINRSNINVGMVGGRLYHASNVMLEFGIKVRKGWPFRAFAGADSSSPGSFFRATATQLTSGASRLFCVVRAKHFDYLDHVFSTDFAFEDLAIRLSKKGLSHIAAADIHMMFLGNVENFNDIDGKIFAKHHEDFVDENLHYAYPSYNIGISFDNQTFDPRPRPSPKDADFLGRDRVLLINDAYDTSSVSLEAFAENSQGHVVYRAMLDGFNLTLISPTIKSRQHWDIRDPDNLFRALYDLQITRVVMPQLIGAFGPAAVPEFVRAMNRSNIPFKYTGEHTGNNKSMLCPRMTDMTIDGSEPCENSAPYSGPQNCLQCVMTRGTPFGFVDPTGWYGAWAEYNIINNPAYAEAMKQAEPAE